MFGRKKKSNDNKTPEEMTRKEFLRAVKRMRVPYSLFNIDGKCRDDERFCLVRSGEKWEVYYSERGRKTTDEFFDSESEALSYIISRFLE